MKKILRRCTMIKRLLSILVLVAFGFIFFPLLDMVSESQDIAKLGKIYLSDVPGELNSANLVTSVVVSYRGLDTLGEVTVLFAAAAGIMLAFSSVKPRSKTERQSASELLTTGSQLLFPVLTIFAVYIFSHGHLSPGGGFQGGVILASAILFLILGEGISGIRHSLFTLLEGLAGFSYVAVGLAGIWLAGGFLDPRWLPAGEFGSIFSAGAIPVIYSLIGLKVGAELTAVLDAMRAKGGHA
jgi:multicomponent Na+:H+ antiporter subunit B